MASKSTDSPGKQSAVKESPLDLIFLALAGMYEQMGQVDSALSIYNSTLKRNPRCVTALAARSLIWLLKSQDDKAVADAQKAASMAPRDRNALRTRGIVQIFAGSLEAALKDFRKALEASEWDSLTVMFAYMILAKTEERVEASELLNNAIDNSKIKAKEWPFQVLQYFRGDISMTDLMAMANAGKSRMMDCRAYLGLSKALSHNPQEGKPDLQFVYNSRAGSPLIKAVAVRGLKLLQEENADSLASKRERADRNLGMDYMG